MASGSATPMEVATHDAMHYGASGPKQLAFGQSGSDSVISPMKAPPPRVTVSQPADSPDMDHKRIVGEVHRLFEQGQVDAQHFQEVSNVFENHCSWINGCLLYTSDAAYE